MFKRYGDVCAKLANRLNVWQWWLMAIVLWVVSQQTMGWLNGLYAASQFPVSFFVGQTTFNAAELKSYYAVLLELGTLDKFIGVQLADYVYMATVLASLFVAIMLFKNAVASPCSLKSGSPVFSLRHGLLVSMHSRG